MSFVSLSSNNQISTFELVVFLNDETYQTIAGIQESSIGIRRQSFYFCSILVVSGVAASYLEKERP